ncbi:MAG: BON domain-containing protein [Bdellovibrionales bacterium]
MSRITTFSFSSVIVLISFVALAVEPETATTKAPADATDTKVQQSTVSRPAAQYRDNAVSNTVNFDDQVTTDAEERAKAGLQTSPAVTREGARIEPTLQTTTQDQNSNPRDVSTSERIREALRDSDLSATAKNIRIVTFKGVTTLEGWVSSLVEKNKVSEIAQRIAPKINNELVVKR